MPYKIVKDRCPPLVVGIEFFWHHDPYRHVYGFKEYLKWHIRKLAAVPKTVATVTRSDAV